MKHYEFINAKLPHLRTQLTEKEWERLLDLAEKKGWEREPDRDYFREGVIDDADGADMAAAVRKGLHEDVPAKLASPPEEELLPPNTLDSLRYRPGDVERNPFLYFSGHHRRKLIDFVNVASSFGDLLVQPLPEPDTER